MSDIFWQVQGLGGNIVPVLATILGGAFAGPATAGSFVIEHDDDQVVFEGDFTVDGAGNLTGGEITGFHLYHGEDLLLDASGYQIDVSGFLAALQPPAGTTALDAVSELLVSGPMTIQGSPDIDVCFGGAFADRLVGGGGADTLYGNNGRDVLLGGDGADTLFAGNGKDLLKGGAGADDLFGGRGADVLKGGSGFDTFHFDLPPNAGGVDKIDDFKVGQDMIALSINAFDKVGGLGVLSVAKFHTGTHAHDKSDRVIYDDETGSLYYDADGKGGDAQVKFAKLHAGLHLSNADFLVVDDPVG